MVFSNITNNDESKENAKRKSSRNKSFDELTLEDF